MRQRIIHIFFLLTALATFTPSFGQKALFDKYEDTDGVTTIYISKTMLGMISNVKAGKHDIGKIASKLDYLRILSCEKQQLASTIHAEAQKLYKSGGYEAIMKMNDDGERMTIYQRTLKGGKNEFVLVTEEKSEVAIINLVGMVTLKEIQDICH